MICRAARHPRIDAFQQIAQVVGGVGNGYPGQRGPVVRILQNVRDLGQQQPGSPVDRTAAAGERLIGKPAGGVDQHHTLGPPLHHEASEPGEVVGQFGATQRGGGLGV